MTTQTRLPLTACLSVALLLTGSFAAYAAGENSGSAGFLRTKDDILIATLVGGAVGAISGIWIGTDWKRLVGAAVGATVGVLLGPIGYNAIIGLYILPTLIALARGWLFKGPADRANFKGVFVWNIFFGWLLVPWVLSLIWSIIGSSQRPVGGFRSSSGA